MTKRDIIIASSGFAIALVLIGGGLAWHSHQNSQKKSVNSAKQTVGDHTISLSEANKTEDTGGLSVSNGSSTGQLDDVVNKKTSSSNGGGSASGGSSIDPSTFKQYDKYISGTSGLFADIQKGTGKELTSGHKAVVVYKGWLTDGSLFDESRTGSDGKVQAFSFTMGKNEVIPGWEQSMYNMKAGGIRMLIVPPAVGYGAKGQGPVPPNAVLVFAVQLVSVD